MKRDFYETLGVTRDASLEEITKAFRQAAKKFHPDQNPGHESEFQEANAAYETLSDPKKRALYNQQKTQGNEGFAGGFGFDVAGDFYEGATSVFGDVFDEFSESTLPPKKGRAVRVKLSVGFMEAIAGVAKTITVTRGVICMACSGHGHEPMSMPLPCTACGGSGDQLQADGFAQVRTPCPACGGAGNKHSHPCGPCVGEGKTSTKVKIEIRVPAGTADGTRLRLSGQGEPGQRGGPDGDLICRVLVKPHAFFARRGNDIILELAVPYYLCVLGGSVNVPTIGGRHVLEIPKGTRSGSFVRIAGGGVVGGKNHTKGDQLVRVTVNVPKTVSPEQTTLLLDYSRTDTAIVVGKTKEPQ